MNNLPHASLSFHTLFLSIYLHLCQALLLTAHTNFLFFTALVGFLFLFTCFTLRILFWHTVASISKKLSRIIISLCAHPPPFVLYVLPSSQPTFLMFLTGESSFGEKFLCRPVEHEDLEGVFLTGVQSRHCCPAPCGSQHQLWLRHLWKRRAFWLRKDSVLYGMKSKGKVRVPDFT